MAEATPESHPYIRSLADMTEIFALFKASLYLSITLSAPPLIAAILAGVLVSLVQTLVQVQDQTLPFSIKLLVVAIVLSGVSTWIGGEILGLIQTVFSTIPELGY